MVAQLIIGIVLIVLAIAMTVLILMQTGKDKSLSSTIAGGSADTFFGRSGGSTKEKFFSRATIAISVLFVILTVVLVILTSSAAA
ncbi:MAG: preprotein translocase subunit SecG [Clostridia bacterium]|nr:preprotein translocase subunit SecG [Clostridia bacterium]